MNECCYWLADRWNEWMKEGYWKSPVKWFQVSFSFSDTISHFYNDHLSSGFIMIITGSLALMQPHPCLILSSIQAFASVFWVLCMCSCWPRCQSTNNCYSSPSWEWDTCVADLFAQHSTDRGNVVMLNTDNWTQRLWSVTFKLQGFELCLLMEFSVIIRITKRIRHSTSMPN